MCCLSGYTSEMLKLMLTSKVLFKTMSWKKIIIEERKSLFSTQNKNNQKQIPDKHICQTNNQTQKQNNKFQEFQANVH